MSERPAHFSQEPVIIKEVDRVLLPWNDLFLAVVVRAKLGGTNPGASIFQGVAKIPEDDKRVGIRISPTYVMSDHLPRLVLVNLYDVVNQSEQHVQAFLANSVWKMETPIVQRVEELPFDPNSSVRVSPEEAGKMALEVTLNLNPTAHIPIFETPAIAQ